MNKVRVRQRWQPAAKVPSYEVWYGTDPKDYWFCGEALAAIMVDIHLGRMKIEPHGEQ